jgi:hypothetical protein
MDLITHSMMQGAAGSNTLDPNTGVTWSNVNYASLNNSEIWANNQMTKAVVKADGELIIGGDRAKMAIGGADAYTDPFNVNTGFKALGLSDNNPITSLTEGGAASHNYYQSISHTPNGTGGLTGGAVTYDNIGTIITLPFSVNFFGVSYSKITVNSNGIVYFGDGAIFNPTSIGYLNELRGVPHIAVCTADLIQTSLHTGTVSSKFIVRIGGYNAPDQTTITHVYELHFYNGFNYVDLHIVTAPSAETVSSTWNLKLAASTTAFNQVGGACSSVTGYANLVSYPADYPIQFFIKSGRSYRLNTVSTGTSFTPGTGTLYAYTQYSGYGATSTDGGYNWLVSGSGAHTTIHYNGKKYISFAQYSSGDQESTDAGRTWVVAASRDYAWAFGVTFSTGTFSAASQTLLFAAGGDMQDTYTAIVSNNGGETWTNITAGLGSILAGAAAKFISGTAWNGTEFLVFFTIYSGNDNTRIAKYNPATNTWSDLGIPTGAASGYGTVTAGEICGAYQNSFYDGTAVYRAGTSGILRSTNSTTWTKVQGATGFNQVFKYGGIWVGIASSYGGYATSTDGTSWTQLNTSKSYDFDSAHISGRTITAAGYNGSQYIIGGDTARCATSSDGMTWTNRSGLAAVAGGRAPFQFIWDGTRWWASLEYNNMAFSSDNGVTWTGIDIYGQWGYDNINTIAYGNGIYIIGGAGGKVSTSTVTGNAYATNAGWTSRSANLQGTSWGTAQVNKIIWDINTGYFIAVGNTGKIAFSQDGATWTSATNSIWIGGGGGTISDIVFISHNITTNTSTFCIVGDSAKTGIFSLAVNGTNSVISISNYIYNNISTAALIKVAYNGKRLIACANTQGGYLVDGGKIFYSDDLGTTWTDAKLMDSGWFDDQFYGYYSQVKDLVVNNDKKFIVVGDKGRISHSPYVLADRPQRVISEQYSTGATFATQIQSGNFNAANNNLMQKNDFVIIFVRCDDSTATIGLNRYNNGWVDSVNGFPQVTVAGRQASRVFYTQIARTNGLEYFTAYPGVSTQNLEMRIVVYRPGAGNKIIVFGGGVSGNAGFTSTVTTSNLQNAFQDGVIVNFISGYYGTGTIGTATYTQPAGTTKFGTDTQFSSASEVYRTSRVINQTFTWSAPSNAYMGATSIALKQY